MSDAATASNLPGQQSSASSGLSQAEAAARLARHGPNEVPEPKPRTLLLFLGKFWGLTAWMLELTIALALARGRRLDAGIVFALLIFNGLLSFLQERRAMGAVEALKANLRIRVRTLREGAWGMVDASQLVPGDLMRLRMGDFVPADAKLLSGDLELDQSSLTGESEPLAAGPGATLLSGSVVKSGEASALVLLTGKETAYGKTIQLLQTAAPKPGFDAVLRRVVGWLLGAVGALLALATVASLLQGRELLDILPLMLILLVSAIPVALPAMFTLTLALGSMELTRGGVLVTRLSAGEDAARMDLLCCDKTGTLTANQVSLAELAPASGVEAQDLLRFAALCSQEANHDPIDHAFLAALDARRVGMDGWTQKSFHPFSPQTRRTEALAEHAGRQIRVLKGAVDSVLGLCPGANNHARDEIMTSASLFAQRGYRCLAVAAGIEGQALEFVGLAALQDPPRPGSKGVIAELRGLGVKVMMLTGDALPVARQIASELGLGDRLRKFRHGNEPSMGAGPEGDADGYAEIYPEDKFNIVKGLQDAGHVVGMTGDGVNDAPALKQAEMGVAVSNATDAAKGAAGVVLTSEGLASLPSLIRCGRSIHQRMETWILNKIIKTFQIVVFVVLAFLATGRFIVSTFDMVLLLFLVDFVTLALATDRAKGSLLPSRWEIGRLVKVASAMGAAAVLEALALLGYGWGRYGLGRDSARLHSFSFEILFYFGMFNVMAVRERGPFWSSWPGGALLAAWCLDIALVAWIATRGVPGLAALPLALTLQVIAYAALFTLLLNDRIKLALMRPAAGRSEGYARQPL